MVVYYIYSSAHYLFLLFSITLEIIPYQHIQIYFILFNGCIVFHFMNGLNFLNHFLTFIYLFLTVLGIHCCVWAFSSCSEQGLLFVVVRRLIAVASLVAEHRLQARRLQQLWHVGSVVVAHGLQSTGSVVVAHGLSCSTACGIFLDQDLNPCPLHWQVDS